MATRRIGVIGSGEVGETLANGFLKHGYEVLRASRDPKKLAGWKQKAGARASTGTNAEAARFGDVIVLAVKGDAARERGQDLRRRRARRQGRDRRVQSDRRGAARAGCAEVLHGAERVADGAAAEARAARALREGVLLGRRAAHGEPDFGGTKPTMFLCGNDAKARTTVREILDQFGWETEDLGGAIAARAIEPLAVLWCIPASCTTAGNHAFKLLRK
jgi:predicted dinucleotide-binding enzyme